MVIEEFQILRLYDTVPFLYSIALMSVCEKVERDLCNRESRDTVNGHSIFYYDAFRNRRPTSNCLQASSDL